MSNATIILGLSTLFTGLTLGAIFALVAAGVTVIYGSIHMPNAANGQFFGLAALLGWSAATSAGLPPVAAALLVVGASLPLSWAIERVLVRRFYALPTRNVSYFILTLGLTQILAGIFAITYGQWSDQFQVPPLVAGVTFIGPFPLQNNRLAVLLIALAILGLLFALLRFHRYGRALRAVFQNRDAARLRGVDVERVYLLSFMLGNATIFAGGILYSLAYSFDLSVPWSISVTAFAIMIIGGPGSVLGAFVVAMVFGFTQAIVSLFASPTIATFAYLGTMLLILLVRPSGVFSR